MANTTAFVDLLSPAARPELTNIADLEARVARANEIREQMLDKAKTQHRNAFPLNDNLLSLIFLVQADLNEQQRERFVSSMSLRQVNMTQFTYQGVRELFTELFCIVRELFHRAVLHHWNRYF